MNSILPPIATQHPHSLIHHGDERIDPYYWLRDDTRSNPEVLDYLHAENGYAEAMLRPTEALQKTLYQEMVDLAVVQPGLPFSAPSWHMVENYECVYNDLLAGRGMFLCPMKYPAFPAAWYLPLQLPLPDTCLLTLRDDPRPEIQRLREVFTAVYASRAKLLGEA